MLISRELLIFMGGSGSDSSTRRLMGGGSKNDREKINFEYCN